MIAVTWLCLLAASASIDLVDDSYRIPASDYRYWELAVQQRPALLTVEAKPAPGARDVRVAILPREELDRLRDERAHAILAATEPGAAARLRVYLTEPGRYVVVADNRAGDAPAPIRLRVWLDFSAGNAPEARVLPRNRQLTVILISFAFFFGIVSWSAKKLLSNIKR